MGMKQEMGEFGFGGSRGHKIDGAILRLEHARDFAYGDGLSWTTKT